MAVTEADVVEALRPVEDPELHRSIVDLGMVKGVAIDGGVAAVRIALTVAGCPLRNEIQNRVSTAVVALAALTPAQQRRVAREAAAEDAGACGDRVVDDDPGHVGLRVDLERHARDVAARDAPRRALLDGGHAAADPEAAGSPGAPAEGHPGSRGGGPCQAGSLRSR